MKMRVDVGDPFNSLNVETDGHESPEAVNAKINAYEASVRTKLAFSVVAGVGGFLAGCLAVGFWNGSLDLFERVWGLLGPVVCMILGYYFGQNKR